MNIDEKKEKVGQVPFSPSNKYKALKSGELVHIHTLKYEWPEPRYCEKQSSQSARDHLI